MCSYFCKNLPVVRKFRNVPIFKDILPICPYFLGFKVGKYVIDRIMMYDKPWWLRTDFNFLIKKIFIMKNLILGFKWGLASTM